MVFQPANKARLSTYEHSNLYWVMNFREKINPVLETAIDIEDVPNEIQQLLYKFIGLRRTILRMTPELIEILKPEVDMAAEMLQAIDFERGAVSALLIYFKDEFPDEKTETSIFVPPRSRVRINTCLLLMKEFIDDLQTQNQGGNRLSLFNSTGLAIRQMLGRENLPPVKELTNEDKDNFRKLIPQLIAHVNRADKDGVTTVASDLQWYMAQFK